MTTDGPQPQSVSSRAAPPAATVAALAATLGVASICWVVSVRHMAGMDMGVASGLGSFGFFAAVWVAMMAAMMLPGAAPAAARHAQATARKGAVPLFMLSYLGVWALVGLAVYAGYRPHSVSVAAAVVIAAGAYELTPLKRRFRHRCYTSNRSGVVFGLDCVGSSIGLMSMLVALGVMSLTWMAVTAVLVTTQKLLPVKPALDVALALTIVGFGIVIAAAPSTIPALMPPPM